MSHAEEKYKIVVAERSLIIRSGVVTAIRRAVDSDCQFFEVTTTDDLHNNIRLHAPQLVIINPFFCGGFDLSRYRLENEAAAENVKFIAIQSIVISSEILKEYDGVITICDTPQTIHATVDRVMGYDQEEDEAEDEILSQREKEIICEVVRGNTNKDIAKKFNLSVYTITTHRRNISKKLKIHSSTALAMYALANKLVSIDEVKGLTEK